MKRCKVHPAYKAKRAPRHTAKHPGGCAVCWKLYRGKLQP